MRQLAGRYGELGDVGQGARLLRQAIASIAGTELAAPTSGVPVNLACSLADSLLDGGDREGARAELDRADALMAAGADMSPASRAECRLERSYLEMEEGAYASAIAILRDVVARLAAAGIGEGEQVRVVRSALSRALLAQGDVAAAMAIAQPLLAQSTAAQGRESMAVLRRSSIVTGATRLGGDPLGALALSEVDRATASHLLGPGRGDANVELEHGGILSELARFREAATTLARSAALAEASGDQVVALRARLGDVEALLGAGAVADAQAHFAALAAARASAPEPRQIEALRIAGRLAAAAGDRDAARRDFARAAERIAAAPKDGARPHPQQLDLALARAELDLAAGDGSESLAQADVALAAARACALASGRPSAIGRALLWRARSLAAAGRPDDARADADSALAHLEPTLGAAHPAAQAAAFAATPR